LLGSALKAACLVLADHPGELGADENPRYERELQELRGQCISERLVERSVGGGGEAVIRAGEVADDQPPNVLAERSAGLLGTHGEPRFGERVHSDLDLVQPTHRTSFLTASLESGRDESGSERNGR